MRIEAVYGELTAEEAEQRDRGYAFDVEQGTRVGDLLTDGEFGMGQVMTVVRIGSDYDGPVRGARRLARAGE